MCALIWLIRDQRYTAFLRPEFGLFLGIGVLLLSIFSASGIIACKTHPLRISSAIRALILLLPLICLVNAQGLTLDTYAFQMRSLNTLSPRQKTADYLPIVYEHKKTDTGSETPQPSFKSNTTIPNRAVTPNPSMPVQQVTILDLLKTPGLYEGKSVKLSGMVYHDRDVDKIFGNGSIVVFRFVINCCVADAIPAVSIVQLTSGRTPENNTWVEAQGTFFMEKENGQPMPVLKNALIKQVQKPAQPYLF